MTDDVNPLPPMLRHDPTRTATERQYYEAPTYYQPQHVDPPSVFLAGGITGVTVPWHRRAISLLAECEQPFVVLNPNRANFPIDDVNAGFEQVTWEQHHLWGADFTLFWFPESDRAVTTQPIAMFELGQCLTPGSRRRIVVGADPRYPRQADVRYLAQIHRPGMPVWSTLEDTITALHKIALTKTSFPKLVHEEREC